MNEITLTLYRGLNGTNPGAFRIDEDGVSVFENPLPDYKFNLKEFPVCLQRGFPY